jgi:hypothetical protein
MRLAIGLVLGTYAWVLIGVQRRFKRPAGGWLSRRIGVAILRMYSLRGGVDEGAIALYELWGDVGTASLQAMLRHKQLQPLHEMYARLLLGGEEAESLVRELQEAAAQAASASRSVQPEN